MAISARLAPLTRNKPPLDVNTTYLNSSSTATTNSSHAVPTHLLSTVIKPYYLYASDLLTFQTILIMPYACRIHKTP